MKERKDIKQTRERDDRGSRVKIHKSNRIRECTAAWLQCPPTVLQATSWSPNRAELSFACQFFGLVIAHSLPFRVPKGAQKLANKEHISPRRKSSTLTSRTKERGIAQNGTRSSNHNLYGQNRSPRVAAAYKEVLLRVRSRRRLLPFEKKISSQAGI